jgi:hypothetical protein
MLDGIERPSTIKKSKREFASIIVDMMAFVGQLKNSDEISMAFRLNRVGLTFKANLPKLTKLYNDISSEEPLFIYRQEIILGKPELIVGNSIIVALHNIITSVQPSLDYPIADEAFYDLVTECKNKVEEY